ncbi:MAG TPA: carbon-nitrogen hydrolase family protein [Dongiaceae bacterium]|nr:carbon-nitrogen hydrolase family protein [Dongiaceae bacterium]
MKVALGQTIGTPGDIAANLALMERLAKEASARGADLLLLPELFLSGYNIGTAIPALAETCEGPSAIAAATIAKAANLAIGYGYPERAPEGIYNAALVLDRQGRIIANYRKSHLWGAMERAQFLPGDAQAIFTLGGLRFGFMICYDIDFPEFARSLALAGVDAIIGISATTKPYHVIARRLIPARAYENRLFFLFANRAGTENGMSYTGESCIAAPDGEVVAQCGDGEELVIGSVDAGAYAAFRRDHRYETDRRPHLYQP